MKRVGVAGWGMTALRHYPEKTHGELVFEAVDAALRHAGIEGTDTVVDAGIDLLDGKGISNSEIVGAAGVFLKEETKVEEDGLTAAYYAWLRLLSGMHRTALVFGYSKASGVDLDAYSSCMFDPATLRPLGLTDTHILALEAQAWLGRNPDSPRQAARRVARARPSEVDEKKVMASPVVSSPLRALDLPPYMDGACAVILSTEDSPCLPKFWIEGASLTVDGYDPGRRGLIEGRAFKAATSQALSMAGHKGPDGMDVLEVSCPSSFHDLIYAHWLGISPEEERFNPSGGMLAGTALVANGLIRLVRACEALQSHGRGAALVHGGSGIAMQSHAAMVVSS